MNTSTTAKLVGTITARTARGRRRSHGQQRAAESQSWKAEARADIAALRMVTV
ncbi:hypothetical protein [Lentzea sp. NPDC092896]|uniref:hypothetical protein n=1 Tax=Lentzea sp. NPDC092896 TaxID=3364127 RepID=UPI0037FF8593